MYYNCEICNRTIVEGRQDHNDTGYEPAMVTQVGSKYLKTCESCYKEYQEMELRELRELQRKIRSSRCKK